MRDLDLTEVAQVNGGLAPIVVAIGAPIVSYTIGFIAGYAKEKRDQHNKEKEAPKQP